MTTTRPSHYDPLNWYWKMVDTPGQVWSSASDELISTDDPGYQAWAETNTAPQATWPGLYDLMMQYKPQAAAQIAVDYRDKLKPSQVSEAMLAAGCTIESKKDSSLDGTYRIDAPKINAVVTNLNSGKGFPGKKPNIEWPDIEGNMHTFDEDEFLDFSHAIENYAYDIRMTEMALTSGQEAEWPTLPVDMDKI